MTQISSYYAKVSLSTDMAALKKVDRYLKLLEAKLAKFHKKGKIGNGVFNINFAFNTNRLQFEVQKAFNDVSRRVIFPVNRFQIDQSRLTRDINSSIRQAMLGVNRNLTLNPRVTQPRGVTGRAAALGQPTGGLSARQAGLAGGSAGIFSRYGGPAILGGATLYGGSALNRANQEIISAQLTTQAVVEAQGLKGEGPAAFEWLRGQGNRIGFSYLDQAQDYNNFLSNSLGAGRTLDQAQNTYLGFAEYARAMGTSPARQKLVMNALSQMEAKGTVSMEELRRQMAESMPGTMSVFAEALQRQTGGGLQGQEAMQALMEAVPEGRVKSDILPIVSEILRERAKPKLDIAMKTSQAEQARAVNLLTDFTNIASKAGLEEGFSRIFRTFTDGLSKSEGLVKSLAEGFNNVTVAARNLLLVPQSISRMFSGEDSVVGDWVRLQGPEGEKIVLIMSQVKSIFSGMGDLISKSVDGWKDLFKVLSDVGAFDKMLEVINNILWMVSSITKAVQAATNQDWGGVVEAMKDAGSAALLVSPGNMLLPDSVRNPLLERRERALGGNPDVNNVFGKQQRIDRFNAEGPAGVLPMTREQQASAAAATVPISSGGGFIMGDINIEVSGMEFTGMNTAEAMDRLASKGVNKVQEELVGAALLMYPTTQ